MRPRSAAGLSPLRAPQVRLLLARGADADLTDACGLSPLMMAARKGHIGVIRRLLEAGARTDLADQAGNEPFLFWTRRR